MSYPRLLALVIPVVLIAVGLRLTGITAIGVGGSDTILYYTLAESWNRGELTYQIGDSTAIFRPVLLAFNGWSLSLFGHTDAAIKLANVSVDALNILLVAALAWTISRRTAVVLASVVTYAFLPIAIWSARQELPHTLSTLFALLCALPVATAIVTDTPRRRTALMALAGLALLGAVLVHEELVLLALPYLLVFLLSRPGAEAAGPVDKLGGALAFCFFPAVAGLLVLLNEPTAVVATLGGAKGFGWEALVAYPERALRYLWNGIVGASSSIFALASLVAALTALYLALRKRPADAEFAARCAVCFLVPVVFIALYAVFIGTVFPRGLLPVMPLLIIGVFCVLDRVSAGGAAWMAPVLCLVLAGVVIVSSLASFTAFKVGNRRFGAEWAAWDWPTKAMLQRGYAEFLVDARYVPGYITHWRQIHAALAGRIDARNRLLVVPSTVFYAAGRRALQTRVYFGDNSVYRLDHFDQPLAELIRRKNIRYVLFTTGQNRGVPTAHRPYTYAGSWGEQRPVDLAAAYRLDPYSVRGEFRQVATAMQALGGRPLTLFPEDSFEARYAVVWELP